MPRRGRVLVPNLSLNSFRENISQYLFLAASLHPRKKKKVRGLFFDKTPTRKTGKGRSCSCFLCFHQKEDIVLNHSVCGLCVCFFSPLLFFPFSFSFSFFFHWLSYPHTQTHPPLLQILRNSNLSPSLVLFQPRKGVFRPFIKKKRRRVRSYFTFL